MSSKISESITIGDNGGKFAAYLSRPSTEGRHPAVIVIHEWWGLVPHVKDIADRYASQGYVALAPDLFNGAIAHSREEASKLSSSLDTQTSSRITGNTLNHLKNHPSVRSDRIGITGFCFGGTHSFHFTCVSNQITAGAIYYATKLPTEDLLAKITAPLLVIYGDQDGSVKPDQARQLESTLKRLGKQAQLLMYPNAPHAFFNDQNPQAYRPEAAKDAWEKTMAFFGKHLKA
ncbi:MAG: dienelactone hydrolase family protein [Thaumarchaeota archaeon]|nr:dienelactone hydrolase family protein [Nitrososphaerota archaeon]